MGKAQALRSKQPQTHLVEEESQLMDMSDVLLRPFCPIPSW